MKTACVTLFLLLLVLPRNTISPQASENNSGEYVERYQYEAVPIDKEGDREEIELALSFEDESIGLASTAISRKVEERIQVRMTREGQLITGARSLTDSTGSVAEQKIWRDKDSRVHIEQTNGNDKRTKTLDIPEGATLAVEGSLLVLLRFFPYGGTTQWDLFMIDFSGKSASATARQTGIERIEVPAGEFDCYRVEVLFHVRILNPKAICWVTREKPHIVVKSVGKRGIFTPKYITSLTGGQTPEPTAVLRAR